MTRKEEERVEAERQRMRRLMSEGHISAREFRAAKLFQTASTPTRKLRKTSRPSSQPHSYRKQKTAKVVMQTFSIRVSLTEFNKLVIELCQKKERTKIDHTTNTRRC